MDSRPSFFHGYSFFLSLVLKPQLHHLKWLLKFPLFKRNPPIADGFPPVILLWVFFLSSFGAWSNETDFLGLVQTVPESIRFDMVIRMKIWMILILKVQVSFQMRLEIIIDLPLGFPINNIISLQVSFRMSRLDLDIWWPFWTLISNPFRVSFFQE